MCCIAGVFVANRAHLCINTFCYSGWVQPNAVRPQHLLWLTTVWVLEHYMFCAGNYRSMR